MTDPGEIAFPDHAHVPGVNARHAEDAFDAIRASAVAGAGTQALAGSLAWRAGLAYYRGGYFWECHEVLEAVWMACAPNSAERHFVQAIIQLANGRLKLAMGRPGAAARLGAQAGQLLHEAGLHGRAPVFGVGFDFVAREIAALADAATTAASAGTDDRKYNA